MCSVANAQTYTVARVKGTVEIVASGNKKAVKVGQKLAATDVVSVGMYSLLELIDESAMKKATVKDPGQGAVKQMIGAKNNSLVAVSKSYLDFIKKQVSGGGGAVRMSDPATITMAGVAVADSTDEDFDPLAAVPDGPAPNGFLQEIQREYRSFRQQCMDQYIEFMRKSWQEYGADPAEVLPPREELVAVNYDENTASTNAVAVEMNDDRIIKAKKKSKKQPAPMEKIEEVPMTDAKHRAFSFYGTTAEVRFDKKGGSFKVRGTQEDQIADALKFLSGKEFDNMIRDCLGIRYDLHLGDWAYLLMLNKMAEQIYGEGTREARLLTAYIYMQSGYKVRIAADNLNLYLLVATEHKVYERSFFTLDGERYYSFEELPKTLRICNVQFPKEQALSLLISDEMALKNDETEPREIQSRRYPEMQVSVTSNKNLLSFYETYPTSRLGEDVTSRWAMYANTPLESRIKEQLYPTLKKGIAGCSPLEAVEKLLNFVQTGFVYEYDDDVWGHDRAFFAEETLFYPSCDCEDRSILFTRLVRDLVGLPCVLVYYPNHLASAVCFSEPVQGDYAVYQGNRFTVCDPTYIGARAGRSMPGCSLEEASFILLEN